MKKLFALASSIVLGGSLGFGLAGCGSRSAGPSSQRTSSPSGGWRALPAAPVKVDGGLTSVWTGKELIVSGVTGLSPDGSFGKAVGVTIGYDPATRSWRRLARPPKMDNYCRRSAAWTGKEMLVWGCGQAAFDPLTNHWRRLPQAPTGEGIVVWTGRELIGWGGGCCGDAWAGGSAYDPATNTWRTLARSPLAPEQRPIGAWTGRKLVLFVTGINPDRGKPWPARFARAAAYDPASDSWRRIAPPPERREGANAVWDGREILVVGGTDASGAPARIGHAYNPATNRWRRLAPMPSGRFSATAAWTGMRLLIWGASGEPSSVASHGLAYDPKADRWSLLPRAPVRGRFDPTAVWTGRELLVWAGTDGSASFAPARERSAR